MMEVQVKYTNNHFSPLRYPGGKASLSNFLSLMIKNCNFKNDCTYVEPYAGGAGAALELLFLEKVRKIVVNDFDKAIYAIWHCILNEVDRFEFKIKETEVSIREWYKQKEIYNSKESLLFELGFASFYLNRTNRSGIISGGPIGGMKQEGKYKIDVRYNKKGLIQRIKRINNYKNRIEITNEDGIELMKRQKSNSTFYYIDPPYYNKGRSLYLNYYEHEDHIKLADFLNTNSNLYWILTYDNVAPIKRLYQERETVEFSLNYFAGHKKKGKEVMIFSDFIQTLNYNKSQLNLF